MGLLIVNLFDTEGANRSRSAGQYGCTQLSCTQLWAHSTRER